MNNCRSCGYPIMPPGEAYGTVLRFCVYGGAHPTFLPGALTEHEVRKIVRDELIKARVIVDRTDDI